MERHLEVEIDDAGQIRPLNPTDAIPAGRATLVWEIPAEHECFVLSESSLARGWLSPEEDEAWASLQPVK